MKQKIIILLILSIPSIAFTDIYKWKDNKGVTHLTNNKNDIPEEYQNKIETPLTKKGTIHIEDGYIETIENPNSFKFTYHKKDGKKIECYEETKKNMENLCLKEYKRFIQTQPTIKK